MRQVYVNNKFLFIFAVVAAALLVLLLFFYVCLNSLLSIFSFTQQHYYLLFFISKIFLSKSFRCQIRICKEISRITVPYSSAYTTFLLYLSGVSGGATLTALTKEFIISITTTSALTASATA